MNSEIISLFFFSLLILSLGIGLYIHHRKTHKNSAHLLKEKTAQLQSAITAQFQSAIAAGRTLPSFHIVISIAKCGSSTLTNSLRKALYPQPIHHVHVISEEGMKLFATWLHRDMNDPQGILTHLREALMAKLAIEERRERYGRPVGYYICGVREPVALAVSGYFQSFDANQPIGDFSLDQAYHEILNGPVLSNGGIYTGGLDAWFDREIMGILGVDVFQFPFDHQKGYCVINTQGIRVLVLRQENFQSLTQALGDLHRAPKELFEVSDSNRSKDKAFSSTYREAVSQIKFSRKQLDKIYNNRYVQHFYSEHEIAGFKTKWQTST